MYQNFKSMYKNRCRCSKKIAKKFPPNEFWVKPDVEVFFISMNENLLNVFFLLFLLALYTYILYKYIKL